MNVFGLLESKLVSRATPLNQKGKRGVARETRVQVWTWLASSPVSPNLFNVAREKRGSLGSNVT